MERCETLPEHQHQLLMSWTKSPNPDTQLQTLEAMDKLIRDEHRESLRKAAHDDLSAFSEYINEEEFASSQLHLWLCDHLMKIERREILRMLLSMPPGHAKSTYGSQLFPAWYLGRNRNHKYIQAGHTQRFCENQFSKKVRSIVKSPEYGRVFEGVKLSADSKAVDQWGLDGARGEYVTRGVGQGIAGYRAHCAAVDDPFASREDAESEITRETVWSWFVADLTTRLLPKAPLFAIMTRWHPDDLAGRIEKEFHRPKKGLPWTVINLPAIAEDDPKNPDPFGRTPGAALWPEFYTSAELLMKRETTPPRDWNALYRGKPVTDEGNMIDLAWLLPYKSVPEDKKNEQGLIIEKIVKRRTISVDCASKAKERNDYTVIQSWIETMDGKHYLCNVKRGKWRFDDMVIAIENEARAFQAQQILVEDAASGIQYIQTRTGKAPCPVIPIPISNTDKEFRFDGVTPMIRGGLVYVPELAGWLADYIEELQQFPLGTYDDQVDATSQYLAHFRVSRTYGTRKLRGK